jgi:perosamine synthetase
VIDVSRVELGPEEEALVLEVLRSGHLVQGPMVERLEAAFASLVEARHAVAVSSGTTALVAALRAMGVGAGDEVVTSPFTFAATVNAVLEVGATACFADIRLDDFTIDPEAVAAALGPRTAVLLPVHLYGQPADMPALVELAASRGVGIVEDAAQAHGAAVGDRRVGTFGVGCFSLYATKNVTTGEGGMATTDDDRVADRIRLLRNHGMRRRYEHELPGHNYRLTDLQAAVGIPQLDRLPSNTRRRQEHAARLTEGLAGIPGLVTPVVRPGRTHVFHQYTVRVTEGARLARDQLAEALAERGIASAVHYPKPAFDHSCYRDDPRVRVEPMPNAERACREVLSLPVHPALTDGDLDAIVAAVGSLLGRQPGVRTRRRRTRLPLAASGRSTSNSPPGSTSPPR